MSQNKNEINTSPSKRKKENTTCFWLCNSISKQKNQPKEKKNNTKENSLHLSINSKINDKHNKEESGPVIDNKDLISINLQ